MNTNNNSNTNLINKLGAFNGLIFTIMVAVVGLIVMYVMNPKLFNVTFGIEIALTISLISFITIFMKMVSKYNSSPSSSLLQHLTINLNDKPSLSGAYTIALLIIIGFLFAIVKYGNMHTEDGSIGLWVNLAIILMYGVGMSIYMSNLKTHDDKILESLPFAVRDIYNLRFKWTLALLGFIAALIILYIVTPIFMKKYAGLSGIVVMFAAMVIIGMILIYQNILSNPEQISSDFDKLNPKLTMFIKALYVLAALTISGLILYGTLNFMGIFDANSTNEHNIGHTIFNLILLGVMFGIIYKIANAGGYLAQSPLYRLIINTIFYIPCLLVVLVNYISNLLGLSIGSSPTTGAKTSPTEIIISIIIVLLIVVYFCVTKFLKPYLQKKYYTQGGQQLVNIPISTNTKTDIASYQTLNDTDSLEYKYAISFWFYIDSFPPSTSAAYTQTVPLLSYGETPIVKYSAPNNTLLVTVKQEDDNNPVVNYVQTKELEINKATVDQWKEAQQDIQSRIEDIKTMPISSNIDEDGHKLIHKQPDILLQKWNHIVLNYNSGTLDVFYNGKLVKSEIEIVPYIKYDMLSVGSEDGINGNVSNLVYFKNPLNIISVNNLYSSLKDISPPCLDNDIKVVPLPDNIHI